MALKRATSTPPIGSSSFEHLRTVELNSLNLSAQEYEHRATGAKHWHFHSDNEENVFLVALRTTPMDNSGVAHILEHTVLCGSEKYPVRDPFFMMLRRSLNTFMNAFTSSDWTAYPFASKNRKDFNNLLEVYLDAVFFPLLNPLDFAQEGHRVEFETPSDASTQLTFKGVVFNEMKGAMSSVHSILYHTISKYLFANNTYHYNSGGEPDAIVDLSYDQLQAFYRKHYHPSNATFMTFGNIPAHEHQLVFDSLVLNKFQRSEALISVLPEKRLCAPIDIKEAYGVSNDEEMNNSTHHVCSWLLGSCTDLMSRMEAELLSSALLNNSASPLRMALETSKLGEAPSALCGLEDSRFDMSFTCGLEGSNPCDAAAVQQLITTVLSTVATDGMEEAELAAVLHQLEFNQREITGDGYPYGLQIMMSAITPAIHRADVVATLEIDAVLAQLRKNIKNPNYIKNLTQKLLIDNPHQVRLTLAPNIDVNANKSNAEKSQLAKIKEQLDPAQTAAVIQQTAQLEEHQNSNNDASILPKVTRKDVPLNYEAAQPTHEGRINQNPFIHYDQGTNGIGYQMLVTPLPKLSPQQLTLLPHYVEMITELGAGDQSYLDRQKLQSKVTGGFNTYYSVRSACDDADQIDGYLVLSAKGLQADNAAFSELLYSTYHALKFDELDRIRELIAQELIHQEQTITDNGHSYAMSAASAGLSKLATLRFQLQGLASIQQLKQLHQSLSAQSELRSFSQQLAQLHQLITSAPCELVSIADPGEWAGIESTLSKLWLPQAPTGTTRGFNASLDVMQTPQRQAWIYNTQVNFCAKAYKTVPEGHADAAVLQVLAVYLRNCYLHPSVREKGGAYGGGAAQDGQTGVFRFYSYRDPRLLETLTDFDLAVSQFLNDGAIEQNLEEAILGVIADIDAPSSPAGEARSSYFHNKFGRSIEFRRKYRRRVLECSRSDLERVALNYLHNTSAQTAVITSSASQNGLDEFTISQL